MKQRDSYVFTDGEGAKYLVRCPHCHKENWLPAVASGRWVWCGYNANEEDNA